MGTAHQLFPLPTTGDQQPSSQNLEQSAHEAQQPPPVTLTGSYDKVVIGPDDLKDYVGSPPFTSDRIYETTPPGVVMGLAWTSMGGNSLYVEAAGVEKAEGKGSLRTTGQYHIVYVSTHVMCNVCTYMMYVHMLHKVYIA